MGDYGPEFRILLHRAWRRLRDFRPVTVPPCCLALPASASGGENINKGERHSLAALSVSGQPLIWMCHRRGRLCYRSSQLRWKVICKLPLNSAVFTEPQCRRLVPGSDFSGSPAGGHSATVLAYVQHIAGVTGVFAHSPATAPGPHRRVPERRWNSRGSAG